MIRRHLATLRILLMLGDFLLSAAVFLLASALRFEADPSVTWSVGIDVGLAALLFAFIWVSIGWWLGLYRLRARWSMVAEARDLARATLVVIAITLSLLYVGRQVDVSRLFLVILFAAQPAVSLASRFALRKGFEAARKGGRDTNYMIVVGTGRLAEEFANSVERHPSLGVKVVGHLRAPHPRALRRRGDAPSAVISVTRPVLGTVEAMGDIFRSRVVDEVAVCLEHDSSALLEPIVTVAADEGKTVRVPRDPDEAVLTGALQEEFDGFLLRSVIHDGQRDLELALKRVLDIMGSALALLLFSPLLIVVAIIIRWRDGAPVLFTQTRVGRHGRQFKMLKFRTMAVDAQQRLPDVLGLNEVKGAAFKSRLDPRITRTGRFLRRWSIDELPQLINVLRGDMSLVGPRPALPNEVEAYDVWHRRRLSVRPGMTGLWQVEARTEPDFDDRTQLDLRYIDQWSLWMDLLILLRTIPAVFLHPSH